MGYDVAEFPPRATAEGKLAHQLGFQYQGGNKKKPGERFNVSKHYAGLDVAQHVLHRLMDDANEKVAALNDEFDREIQAADKAGTLRPFDPLFAEVFHKSVFLMACNPKFSALSFRVTLDGEFEIARVSQDKLNVDYLTFGQDEETGELYAMFNQFKNSKSTYNTFGPITKVIQQIVSSEVI